MISRSCASLALCSFGLLANAATAQAGVDLRTWTAESYPAVAGFGAGVWNVTPTGDAVTQTVNGQPTLFHSDFSAFNTSVEGQITVTGSDDDFIGFALGFLPGDSTNPNADYLLVDWKGVTQPFDFGAPACTPSSTAPAGLAVSRVRGVPTADEFWGHTDFDATCSALGQGLTELARGANLGATGWSLNVTYTFRFDFDATTLRVFVNGVLEITIAGSFADGRMAFYNFSQADVRYNAFTLTCPASWSNYGSGWPGAQGVPTLALGANPVLGTVIAIQLGNASGSTVNACLVYGLTQISAPSGFGGTWLAEPLGMVPYHPIPPAGLAVQYSIPNDIALCGRRMFAQLVHEDPAASAGVAFSPGLQLQFGQ